MEQLQAYQDLLATTGVDWGLIGPREVERLWERHIDNSLAVTEDRECLPAAATVLDVGTGAGLPGIVWAIARPDLDVTLLEPLERRVRFLDLAVEQLEVRNVTVVRGRAQDRDGQYDRVTARAVAAMSKLLPWLAPLVAGGGRMVLMKGERAAGGDHGGPAVAHRPPVAGAGDDGRIPATHARRCRRTDAEGVTMEQRAGLGWPQEPDEAAGDDRPSAGLGWPTTGEDA